MDLEIEGIRTDMQTDKIETEQNTHPQTRNMNEQHTPETAINFVFYHCLHFIYTCLPNVILVLFIFILLFY